MMLSDTDKADLVQVASGDADSQTRRRAGELLNAVPEAVQFLAKVKSQSDVLTSAFEAAERAVPEEPLTEEQVAAITAGILWRADALQRRVFRRRALAIAAVIALGVTPWVAWKLWPEPSIGHAISTRYGFTGGTSTHVEKFLIRAGTPLVTDRKFTAVRLGRNQIAVAPSSNLQFDDGISLIYGSLYVSGEDPMQVRAGGATIVVQGEVLVLIDGDVVVCRVLSGSARLTIPGAIKQIPSGKQAVVSVSARKVVLEPAPTMLPIWVKPPLELLREAEPKH